MIGDGLGSMNLSKAVSGKSHQVLGVHHPLRRCDDEDVIA
jgi:hypothetical protein